MLLSGKTNKQTKHNPTKITITTDKANNNRQPVPVYYVFYYVLLNTVIFQWSVAIFEHPSGITGH